jgi:hypothetical protein
MSQPSELKDRGNDAFKAKKFMEAIDLYKHAVQEALPSKDVKLLTVLYSNIAQAYLELKM